MVDPAVQAAGLSRDAIVNAALQLGARRGWDALHLHELAAELGLSLAELGRHVDGKDAIAEAWFDRADAALLACAAQPGWAGLSAKQRLQEAMAAWLAVLAPHRRLTAAMLRYKLQPEHLHLQALGLMRVSRTVQWWREAALLPASGWRRELEEAALTAIYLSSFALWLHDEAGDGRRGLVWLARRLAAAEWMMRRFDRRP